MNPDDGVQEHWMVLMKMGQRAHLEALRQDGLLHMNPLIYFAKLEGDIVRADRFEGTDQIHQPDAVTRLTIEGKDVAGVARKIVVTPADMAGPLSVTLSTTPRYNIYCMFGIRRPFKAPFIDARNFAFGDSCILVLDTQAFVDRASAAATKAGLECDFRPVEYYDAARHSGATGPFRKSSNFDYQNEFRIAVYPGRNDPVQILAGSLVDITTPVLPLAEINQLVKFSEENASEAGLV